MDAGIIEDAGETRDGAGEMDAAMPECTSADTCPPASSPCAVAVCEDGSCGFAPAEAGTECRAAAGDCDLAEACDGASPVCPEDSLAPAGTECRASAGDCDLPEACDGASPVCPEDSLAPAGTECRASAGDCDLAEACDGASTACPDDALAPAGTECRAAAGTCDEAEACTGSVASCPDDSGLAALCQPMAPVQVTELGRILTIGTIDLNGTGTPVASVGPGAPVTLRVAGGWVDTNTECGGCATQFYVGIDGVFTECLGSQTDNVSFDVSTTFTSPSTPGVYIVNTTAAWDWLCDEETLRTFSTDFGPGSVATLIVE